MAPSPTMMAPQPMLPSLGVPTTAGTGSEAQSYALICREGTREKMACGDKKAACRVGLLDPTLTLTQPPRITALAGIDALRQAGVTVDVHYADTAMNWQPSPDATEVRVSPLIIRWK